MTKRAKALYLFPTKALAQDQVAELLELNRPATSAAAGDLRRRHAGRPAPGDPAQRRHRRQQSGHAPPGHPAAPHQVGAVLRGPAVRRHRRDPQLSRRVRLAPGQRAAPAASACARSTARRRSSSCARPPSATRRTTPRRCSEADVTAITQSGAPSGDKHVLLWNPPVVNPDLGLRASARSQSNRIARTAIKAGLKTLVFAQSRTMVEVLTKYLKDVFDHDPRKPARIRAYRGGYLPTERRDAERAMRAGPHRRHRLDLGAGTGRGHRQPRCRRAQRLSGLGRGDMAALRPRGPAAAGVGGRAGGELRSARPVRGAASGVLLAGARPSRRASRRTSR